MKRGVNYESIETKSTLIDHLLIKLQMKQADQKSRSKSPVRKNSQTFTKKRKEIVKK